MIRAPLAICLVASALVFGACSKSPAAESAPAGAAPATVPSAAVASGAFPPGTVLGELGLPVYPTPPEQIVANGSETNGDGGVSTSTSMDPHAPFAAVVDWYKAHMPEGALQPGARDGYAMFQIGQEGDKLIRIVIVQHVADHVQTEISLIRKTLP
jgi:hypothetical protein